MKLLSVEHLSTMPQTITTTLGHSLVKRNCYVINYLESHSISLYYGCDQSINVKIIVGLVFYSHAFKISLTIFRSNKPSAGEHIYNF